VARKPFVGRTARRARILLGDAKKMTEAIVKAM